jgi:hypothetical protein
LPPKDLHDKSHRRISNASPSPDKTKKPSFFLATLNVFGLQRGFFTPFLSRKANHSISEFSFHTGTSKIKLEASIIKPSPEPIIILSISPLFFLAFKFIFSKFIIRLPSCHSSTIYSFLLCPPLISVFFREVSSFAAGGAAGFSTIFFAHKNRLVSSWIRSPHLPKP